MKPAIRILFIFLLLGVAVAAAFMVMPHDRLVMADIRFTDIDGQSHQLSEYKGQPVLMVFWATDCPGCIREMPELIALHHEYASEGLRIIGVAMPHDDPQHIQAMRKEKAIPYLITWDKDGTISQKFDHVRVTPTHFLISPEGNIVMRKIGEMDMAQLRQRLAMMGINPAS